MTGDVQLIKPKKLKARIEELDLKQVELSKQFNVSTQTFNGWVKGRITPSLETAFKLSKILECQIEDIFEYIED